MLSFADLRIAPKLLTVLERNQYTQPTPIQAKAIPVALTDQDVIGIAETGTGKTLAFGLPMLERLAHHKGQGLVLVPTRELALQVEATLQKIGVSIGLKTAVLIGGASMLNQTQTLRRRPHIIVATPGRLMDHLEQKTMTLQTMKIVVLDEADRMFDIGFAPQIKKIFNLIPKDRQTMLFSATMPGPIAELAKNYMRNPVRVEVSPAGTPAAHIEQSAYMVSKETKMQLLDKMLTDNTGTVLVFSRTKFGAKRIAAGVRNMGHTAVEIHSNRSLFQRKEALAGFKTGKYRIMVATDIAARGIDVTGISLVINYDLPDNPEDYVHRIGRTGRAKASGRALSFVMPEERNDLRNIERLMRKNLAILPLPVLPLARKAAPGMEQQRFERQPRSFARGNNSGRSSARGPARSNNSFQRRAR